MKKTSFSLKEKQNLSVITRYKTRLSRETHFNKIPLLNLFPRLWQLKASITFGFAK